MSRIADDVSGLSVPAAYELGRADELCLHEAEIARLRAEVDRLKAMMTVTGDVIIPDFGGTRMPCENCTLLTAQVTVLVMALEDALSEIHYRSGCDSDCQTNRHILASPLTAARALLDQFRRLEAFRARVSTTLGLSGPDDGREELRQIEWLLDRLQRAEAVMEALDRLTKAVAKRAIPAGMSAEERPTNRELLGLVDKGREALAAWEKEKA